MDRRFFSLSFPAQVPDECVADVLGGVLRIIHRQLDGIVALVHIPEVVRVGVDDYAKIIIRFQDGLTAQVESTTFSPYPMPKWWILGNRGSIYVEDCCGESGKARFIAKSHTEDTDILFYPGGSLAHRSMDNCQVDDWEEVVLPEHPVPQDWAALYKNLAAHLDGKEDLVVTPESVLRCFRVIEAARKSSETGLAVEF